MDKSSGYFEGVLQLRNPAKDIVKFVRADIAGQPKEKNVFIGKEERLDNGYDFYLSNKRYLRALGKKLQNRFGGQLIESAKIFSRERQTSKDVYRVTVLLRWPDFKKGDVIKYKGMDIRVKGIGKKVFGVDVKTGNKYQINFKELF